MLRIRVAGTVAASTATFAMLGREVSCLCEVVAPRRGSLLHRAHDVRLGVELQTLWIGRVRPGHYAHAEPGAMSCSTLFLSEKRADGHDEPLDAGMFFGSKSVPSSFTESGSERLDLGAEIACFVWWPLVVWTIAIATPHQRAANAVRHARRPNCQDVRSSTDGVGHGDGWQRARVFKLDPAITSPARGCPPTNSPDTTGRPMSRASQLTTMFQRELSRGL